LSTAKIEHNLSSVTVITLLGAALNLSFVYILNYVFPLQSELGTVSLFGGLVSLAVLPFLFSLIFSRFAPIGRIIPAFDIHIASFALVLVVIQQFGGLGGFFYLMGAATGGVYSFQLGSRFVGYPVDPSEVYSRHLFVDADKSLLEAMIEQEAIADQFGLDLSRTETGKGSVLFMRENGYPFQFFMQIKDDTEKKGSIVHLLGFIQTKYGMAKTDDAIQAMDANYDYLRGILDRSNPPILHQDNLSVPNPAQLVCELLSGKVAGASLTLWTM
jgi:hypothetical protein